MNQDQSARSSFVSHSVLESDPEFGFEEAKRQLEGALSFTFELVSHCLQFNVN